MSRIAGVVGGVTIIFEHMPLNRMLMVKTLRKVAPRRTRHGTKLFRNAVQARCWDSQAHAPRDIRVRFVSRFGSVRR